MKRLMISLLGVLAFAAVAQSAEPPAQHTQQVTAQTVHDPAKKADINDHTCLRYTGSHIRRVDTRKRDKCTGGIGRAYTREDMDRTGEVNIAEALRKLDPSIH